MDATGEGRLAWRWVVLGVSAPLFVCSMFYRVANAIVAPHLARDLGLSSEALGTLSASFFYAFAAMQIPLAAVLDRLGARACMAALSLAGAGGAVLFATASSGAAATAGEVLLGIGMAGNLVGSMKLIGEWFPRREFATVAGTFGAIGALGNLLATTPLALAVEAIGWRRTFVAMAAATAALALVFLALARERPRASPGGGPGAAASASLLGSLRRLVGTRDYWLISFGAFCRYGSFVAIQALWAGPWLVEVAGLSPVRAANLILLLNVAYVAGSPIGGWISDRVLSSRKKLVLAALAGTGAAEVALALTGPASPTWAIALGLGALGVVSSFGQVVWAHVKEVMPSDQAGMAMSAVNFFNILGAAAFLQGSGWVLDRWSVAGARTPDGYRAAFLAGAAMVAVALVAYAFTRDAPAEDARVDDARHAAS